MDQRHAGWRQFIDGLPVESRLGPVFLESWRGVQVEVEEDVCGSETPPGNSLDPAELLERLDKNRELLDAAHPTIEWADRALGHISHLVYLIDREGIVLHAVGNDPAKMAKLKLLPGYDWSEASKGRNGAGTALAENRPVAVVGPDHLTHPLDDCTWTGVPLHAPDGTLIGAIGITTCAEDGTPDRLILTAHLAQLIEQDLVSRHAKQSHRLPSPTAVSEEEGPIRSEILEAIADPFWLLDEQWRFVSLNREAERLLGRTREELMGQVACAVFPGVVGSTFERKFQEAKETGLAVDFELFFPERDAWHVVHAQPSRFGLIVHTHDITTRKRTEDALKDADRRKDEFLAMLAHELRNPLAPLRNALHALKPDVAGTSIEPVQAMMERQVDRLARLIDDLLDVSRINRGTIALRKEVVDLAEPAHRALESLGPRLEEGRQVLTVTMPDGPLLVEGDAVRLEQVFDNLLDNAIKYTKPGGTIRLEVGREADLATIRVSDTGVGIVAEMLPHIFDLFIQAERLLVQSQGGLGIGLNLVRRLVEMHGGRVMALSAGPGLGSEFLVRIPALPESSRPPPGAKPTATPGPQPGPRPRHRILVVDDNVDSARSMASLLSRLWNQVVAVAYDASSALALADSFHPDVVLLDIGLPGPSGYELARRLRERPGFQTTLLVAMSGWGREEDRRKSREAGIDHHLVKPISPTDLEILLAGPETSAAT